MKIEFTKMHGLGNDYIYVNTMKYPLTNPEEKSIAWSRPHTGIGSDGLVLIGDSDKADFSMRILTRTVLKPRCAEMPVAVSGSICMNMD